ncbi:MAG: ATP-binding cassette domain-containing protein [Candidatus Latescibacteria bacterium]|jgi:sodium transport system ATP-binding protein|nr:ATP-binding cassette domain-containing protein [Candidatus Latescibacterota bacterium]
MVIVDNVTKTFRVSRRQKREMGGDFTGSTLDAVREVSFTCQPGRVFALLGPNGAGKTTALRLIATMLKPTSGRIEVGGYDVERQAREVRSQIGFLTGSTGLYDRLTANEMVKYYADLHHVDRQTFIRRRDELFTTLDMSDFAGRRIGKLSSGMRQKVSIVRTMIHDPEVLVFDEPTAGLDVVASRNIIDLIRDCRNRGRTVLFSTHRMGEVSQLSDDLAIIHRGRLCYNGTYEAFQSQMERPSLEDEFIRVLEEAEE